MAEQNVIFGVANQYNGYDMTCSLRTPLIRYTPNMLNNVTTINPYFNTGNIHTNVNLQKNRYSPYYRRNYGLLSNPYMSTSYPVPPATRPLEPITSANLKTTDLNNNNLIPKNNNNGTFAHGSTPAGRLGTSAINMSNKTVTLQISNLDSTLDERMLTQYLMAMLKPITPVMSLVFESPTTAKIWLPSQMHAKQVVAHLHRKKIGYKRVAVSYTRESSSMELSTLRCQVAGLLKDIPQYKLSLYKFRELFQSRFKTSISVVDLYEMQDICTITDVKNEDKFISLHPALIQSIENMEYMECFQHSAPYCTIHFKKEQHRGWAEQEMEPLPNIYMSIAQIRSIVYPLMKSHKGDIPTSSLIHCIEAELNVKLESDDRGVNLEHLICCVNGIYITSNKFGIKILSWMDTDTTVTTAKEFNDYSNALSTSTASRFKSNNCADPFSQISREVVELLKMAPKSTMKFNRFIPAYHNHFGKQCRVADYGYTKLIELFEALSTVVQVMGEGENRLITITHKAQVRRFTTDLLRILRTLPNKAICLKELPETFSIVHSKIFDITDYGVCNIEDILDGLANSNIIVLNTVTEVNDIVISIPTRKQTKNEIENTSIFAGEVVELFKRASQYTIPFEKFSCSYNYHFGYQCRLSDYGFLKLADLMDSIQGVVMMECSFDKERLINLAPKIAQRIFSEQIKDLIKNYAGTSSMMTNLNEVLHYHKKQYGYQMQPQSLGFKNMLCCVRSLPFVEMIDNNGTIYVICHHEDSVFRTKCYTACNFIMELSTKFSLHEFINYYKSTFNEAMNIRTIESMKHVIQIELVNGVEMVSLSKMMQYVVRITEILENKTNLKIADIKTILDISWTDCFCFGYPNFNTFMQAWPEIFQFSSEAPLNENVEVKLSRQWTIIKRRVQECIFNASKNISYGSTVKSVDLSSSFASSTDDYGGHFHNKFNHSFGNNSSLIGENPTNTSIAASTSRMDFDCNVCTAYKSDDINSYNSDTGRVVFQEVPQTYKTNQNTRKLNGNRCTEVMPPIHPEAIKNYEMHKHLLHSYFDPPKPDSPTEININLPDLKTFAVVPKLDTPTIISRIHKGECEFSFDKNTTENGIIIEEFTTD